MKSLVAVLALGVSLLAAGCATSGGVTLPPLPAWQAPTQHASVTAAVVVQEARARLPSGTPINYSDSTYTAVSADWLDRYLAWTWDAAKSAGVHYTPESFDCENFTGLFSEIVGLAAGKAGVKAAPLVAHVVVQWDATSRHELVGVVTDRGVFIVEPQPDAGPFRKWPLETYPKPILAVTFGSYNRPW